MNEQAKVARIRFLEDIVDRMLFSQPDLHKQIVEQMTEKAAQERSEETTYLLRELEWRRREHSNEAREHFGDLNAEYFRVFGS